ncbi:MAG TPA: DUF4089 domain-containing protein [Leptolyngbyaceae cyanobacterium M65_K2018_010]|nr:DUF4089 domain-containing protein [Leptolyngbyaceae cyanobacterium M65_K2018_010]
MTTPPPDAPVFAPIFDATTYVQQTAALLGLPIPAAIEAGVIANFEQIQAIAQPLVALNLPEALESATTFAP